MVSLFRLAGMGRERKVYKKALTGIYSWRVLFRYYPHIEHNQEKLEAVFTKARNCGKIGIWKKKGESRTRAT